jgi:D-3-phosphoglycerate dehydrogenase
MEKMPIRFWQELERLNLTKFFSEIEDREAEIVIIRTKTKFDSKLIDKFPNLRLIIRAGSGFDNIDVLYAKSKNIEVCNTPEANAYSAYEHTLSMIFALIKNLQFGKQEIKLGNWKDKHPSNWEIPELKVLVVGLGRVGTKVANALGFLGAKVKAVDPGLSIEDWQKKGKSPIHYISGLEWCNLVTYHCPLYTDTYHYFNQDVLSKIKNPIWLVNAARGEIVDFEAVKLGLENGKLLGAAIDVFEEEPWIPDSMIDNPGLIVTPHTGAFSTAAKNRMSIECVDVWRNYVLNGLLISPVDFRFINKFA